jgi:hypothetical protein
MSERIWLMVRNSSILAMAWIVVACLASCSRATPFFTYNVGQTPPGPTMSDPGPYAPNGFSMNEGSYSATTTQNYFDGTTWQPVPHHGWHAALISPCASGRLSGPRGSAIRRHGDLGHDAQQPGAPRR